jgi:hypothetical protein
MQSRVMNAQPDEPRSRMPHTYAVQTPILRATRRAEGARRLACWFVVRKCARPRAAYRWVTDKCARPEVLLS